MPEQPGGGQPRPDDPRETAKTPDEIAREGEDLQQRAEDAERFGDQAHVDAAQRAITERENAYDQEHALGDALMGLGGGRPQDKPDFENQRAEAEVQGFILRDAARKLRDQAAQKFKDAAWARQAIAGALLAVGGLMTIGGVAGAGNTPAGAGASATPFPTTTLRTPAATGTAAAGGPNLPPVAGPIIAVFNAPQTSYSVQATDPEGRTLTYTWQKTGSPCGTFTSTNNVAVWNHPDPPCPNEAVHPGIIFVNVSDGVNEIQRVYTQGSAPGTGNVPPSPSGSATPFPTTTTRASATPFPTTTTRDTPTPSPGPDTGGGPNGPLTGGGILVAGAGAALLVTQEKKKNCDREKAEEERTRAAMDRAKEKYDDLNQTKTGRDFARSEAAKADRAYEQSKRGAAIGEDTVTHQPTFGSGAKSQAAAAAYAKAQAAHDEANIRQHNYDAKGGDAAWQQAKSDYDAAKAAHDAAAAALARCLEETAPPPPPPTDGGGGTTTDGGGGGGGTTPPGGPVVSTGGGQTTQERKCVKGTRRNEASTSREFKFNELNRAEVCIDSNYPYAVDPTYVEEFMDWLGTVRDTFKAGKTIKSFMGGEIVEGGLDLVDFPDFYTYFDKMTDELRKSMDRLVGIMRKKAKTGDWYLRYSRQVFTVTCTTFEECDGNGNWVAGRGMKNERTGTERNKQTNKIQVDDVSEVQATLDTLFRGLTRENDQNERNMKEFERTCGQ